jgi:hypothetical protein
MTFEEFAAVAEAHGWVKEGDLFTTNQGVQSQMYVSTKSYNAFYARGLGAKVLGLEIGGQHNIKAMKSLTDETGHRNSTDHVDVFMTQFIFVRPQDDAEAKRRLKYWK